MGTSNLVSKIAAGGLSAGIFLIWWPGHIAADGLGQLVVRGLLWTLAFELLLLAFAPLERLLTRAVLSRLPERPNQLRTRLAEAPAPARTGGAVALASVGLVVPLLLLADPGRPPEPDTPPKREVKLVKQVVVKRPVIKREVVVRPEIVSPSPSATTTAPAPAPGPNGGPASSGKPTTPNTRDRPTKASPTRAGSADEPVAVAPDAAAPAPAEEPAAAAQP